MHFLLQFLIFVLFLYIFWNVLTKSKYKLPPGPMQLPLIGSMISVLLADSKNPMQAFVKMSKTYGPIFSLKLGSVTTVVLSSHELLSRVQFSDKLLVRFDMDDVWMLEKSAQLPIGLLLSFNEFWVKTRSMLQKTLHQCGFHSSSKIEATILEIAEFCESLQQRMTNGQVSLEMETQFSELVFNSIWKLLTGKKFTSEDTSSRQAIFTSMKDFVSSGSYGAMSAMLFPKLIKLFPNLTGYTKYKRSCAIWRKQTDDIVAQHIKTTNPETEPDNFLNIFLAKLEAIESHENPMNSIYTRSNLVAVVQDLFGAGIDTQSNFPKFFIRYLLQNPLVQDQIYAEVDQVLGKSQSASVDDIPKLIYTQAVMYEVLRLSSLAPVSPRKLIDDWEVNGFLIPKGTLVAVNIFGIDRDETVWKNAETFNPERFLSPQRKLINTEKIFSFGYGKRNCIGEHLAKTNLMLLIATLVQKFSFHVDPAFGIPADENILGLSRDPAPFNVVIKARQM